ncbi:hypothetical protein [Mycetocola sp. CAN_C7]|uniref:hypothetical protein n=1 Tax=Mycetocola sp. CAN_C7 TaxID=2787724 RepID=UPI0018CB0D9B
MRQENDMQARQARVTRGVLAAAVSTFAAAFSHGVAASEPPSVLALAAASVLAVAVCTALAGRVTRLRLAVAVVLSQLGFHALFALLPTANGSMSMSGHHGTVTMTTDAAAHLHTSTDPGMWLGHAAAAVVTILALSHGERSFSAIVEVLRLTIRALVRALVALPVPPVACAAPEWLPVRSATTVLLPSVVQRRGPPVALCA